MNCQCTVCLRQGSPTLFLESHRPVGFCSNTNLAHLVLIISWLINLPLGYHWGWNENLQEGSSPETVLENPGRGLHTHKTLTCLTPALMSASCHSEAEWRHNVESPQQGT